MSEAPASALAKAATYRAFISYNRHDAAIAAALATHLTRFARPWYRTRAMRVFLDKNSLSTDPSLGGALERALADSEWLILIASPASAASPWVAHEVEWWLAHRGTAKLIIARTAGVIAWQGAGGEDFDWQVTTALAPLLRGRFATEPLWADLEAAAASEPKSISNPAFRDGFLSVAAQIHGVSKDALWSRERVEQRTRLAFVALVSLMIATLVWGVYRTDSVSMDRKENILSLQLGAKAFSVLPRDATLAAQIALAGVAVRPSGIAAGALRSAAARLAGDLPPRFEANLPGAVDLAFSPRATRLAVLARDGRVTVLDAATGRTLGAFDAPAGFEASALGWGAGGHLVAGGRTGVRMWKFDDEADIVAAATSERAVSTDAAVRALAFSADGAQFALALADGSVRVVSAASGEVTARLAASRVPLRAVAFSNDGKRLATGAEDGEAVLWRLADAAPVRRLRLGAPVASLDFNREGGATVAEHMLALTDTAGAVRVVDADMAAGVPEAAAAPQGVELAPPSGAGGVAARFVESQCLVRAGAAGPVVAEATLGFERLFAFGRVATSAVPRLAMAVGSVPAQGEPAPRPESSLFALLDAAGGVAVHDQPLCGDAEAVCRFADPYLRAPMAAESWARWLPGDLDPKEAVQQAPGPACRALIDRVLIPTTRR